jgi:hypothetical protein
VQIKNQFSTVNLQSQNIFQGNVLSLDVECGGCQQLSVTQQVTNLNVQNTPANVTAFSVTQQGQVLFTNGNGVFSNANGTLIN